MIGRLLPILALVLAVLPRGARGEEMPPRGNPGSPPEIHAPSYLSTGELEGFSLPPMPVPEAVRRAPAAVGETLRQLVLRGNAAIGSDELLEVARPWLGQPANAADLEALRLEITRHYVGRGYLNSGARLAANAFRNGVLTLDIVEGRLSSIRYAGLDGLDEAYIGERLRPDPARPLNLNELRERYQLLLDDPLIRRMNARLAPDVEPGTAILDIAVEREPSWSLSLRVNNHRPASIGERAAIVDAGWRNLTGRGDMLHLSLQTGERVDRIARAALAWTVPLDYRGTQLTLQFDEGESAVVEEPLAAINIRSRLTSREVGINRVMHESLHHRLAVGLADLHRTNRTWIGDEPFPFLAGVPAGGLENHSLRFWQEYAYRSEAEVVALRSTFVRARNNLHRLSSPATATPADNEYRLWLGQGQYARRLGNDGMQFIARATVQESSARMTPLDGLSIGGVASVRGFRENQMIRDRGQVVNLELDIPLGRLGTREMSFAIVPFADYGRGRNRDAPAETIASVGLAFRWRWDQLFADLAWAGRIGASDAATNKSRTLQDQGVHFQVGYSFGK